MPATRRSVVPPGVERRREVLAQIGRSIPPAPIPAEALPRVQLRVGERSGPGWHHAGSARELDRMASWIERTLGVRMPETKRSLLSARLLRRVHALGARSVDEYIDGVLEAGVESAELPHLVDAVTTHYTTFFREPRQLERIMAELPALRTRALDERRPIRAWSAACSHGHELWTLGMMLAEHAPLSQIALLGTDISEPALARAARAIYAADEVAVVPAAMRAKWMMRGRADAGAQVRISPELRAVAELKKVNLMDVLEVHDTFDLVLLRNVLIYFDRPTQDGVVARVAERVRPGGLFCVGTSEALHAPLAGFEPLGLGVHRRGLS